MTSIASAFVVSPDGGTQLQGPVGGALQLKLESDQTNGSFTALENIIGPGEGPPLHTHDAQDEIWFVVSGDVRFRFADELVHAPAGSWAFVPRGTAHNFQNVGTEPARLLVMFTPGGMEPFFRRMAALSRDEITPESFQVCGADQGMTVVGPPLAVSHPT